MEEASRCHEMIKSAKKGWRPNGRIRDGEQKPKRDGEQKRNQLHESLTTVCSCFETKKDYWNIFWYENEGFDFPF